MNPGAAASPEPAGDASSGAAATAAAAPDLALDDAPCGLFVLDDRGRVLAVNRTLAAALDYAPHELAGQALDFVLPLAGRVFLQTHVLPLLRVEGRVDELFLALRTRAGAELPCLLNGVRVGAGAAARYRCATFTIRRRGEYEQQLLWARRQAEQSLRLTEELLSLARQRQAELEGFASRTRALAQRVEELRDAEQANVARSLHEGIAQELAALRWGIDALRGAVSGTDDARQLASLADLAQRSLAQVRSLSYEVRPPALDHAGLGAALAKLAQDVAERSGLAVEALPAGPLPKLAPRPALVLYRFAQEALGNALDHSGATAITVECGVRGDEVYVRVHDDGRGLAPEMLERTSGLGLLGASERLRALGGRLDIVPSPRGADVVGWLPVASAAT